MAHDSNLNNNQPRVAHDSSMVKKVDNLVLHDSTGKNLDANKLDANRRRLAQAMDMDEQTT